MINNLIILVILTVIFRILFEIIFFSKSINESFNMNSATQGKNDASSIADNVNSSAGGSDVDENVYNEPDDDENEDEDYTNRKSGWEDDLPISNKRDEMNSNCCPDNNYSYKTTKIPNECLDGEDDISCLWRVKKGNAVININGDNSFKNTNKKIYGSNSMLGNAMNSLTYTNQDTEFNWVNGTLTDISSSMLDTHFFWNLFKPNVNLKCDSGKGEGIQKPGKQFIPGNLPYIKKCLKHNTNLINQYESKELTEIPCDGMHMDCYYMLFRGNQGGLRTVEQTSDNFAGYITDEFGNSDPYYIDRGDWWLQDDYVQKRVLMYNLKSYVSYYGDWDSDLDTVVEELHEKENTAEYLNNNIDDSVAEYTNVNRETFFQRIIDIWDKPENLKNINSYLAERLGRFQVWEDSDNNNIATSDEIRRSLKVDDYQENTIYDFKLNDGKEITRMSYTDDDTKTTKRNYFHLFKYDEKLEKIIEEVDTYQYDASKKEELASKMYITINSF